jgi:hypothetical protein
MIVQGSQPDSVFPNETVLEADYPVHGGYFYVFDSKCGKYKNAVWSNDLFRDRMAVRHLKHDIEDYLKIEVSEIRRCDITGRKLWS